VLTDLLYIPVSVALYVALNGFSHARVFFGAALLTLFVMLDLAITWPSYAVLIALSGPYAAASDAERGTYVAAASYATAVLESSLAAAYTIGVPSLGILLTSLAMRSAGFGRTVAYLGMATGVVGIISVSGSVASPTFNTAAIVTALLTTVWFFALGYRLLAPSSWIAIA
jgi:hypothetical protein